MCSVVTRCLVRRFLLFRFMYECDASTIVFIFKNVVILKVVRNNTIDETIDEYV